MAFALFEVACHAEALAKAGRSVSMNSASAHYSGDASSNEHYRHPDPAIAGEGSLTGRLIIRTSLCDPRFDWEIPRSEPD